MSSQIPEKSASARKGTGLNSIPVRFGLLSIVSTIVCVLGAAHVVSEYDAGQLPVHVAIVLLALGACIPGILTFIAGNKLVDNIMALQRSTEAILAGDMTKPIEVECACEVGGLADSFRSMVDRLNGNILRMNAIAYSDQVTGLPNRLVALHAVNLLSSVDQKGAVAVFFIDLDGFKRVNDNLGHDVGDDLLRQVGRRIIERGLGMDCCSMDTCVTALGELQSTAPTTPIVARLAGDEFVVVLSGEETSGALTAKAEAIREALVRPFTVDDSEVYVSASIGIARMPVDAHDPESLLVCADLAMYAAKQSGRNRIAHYKPSMSEVSARRAEIENELRHAIKAGQLVLHYQPKFDSSTLEVTGVEALVRWQHPQRGMIPPGDFIAVAENSGLMHSLGNRVIEMATRQCRAWLDAGEPRVVSVNVSPAQFSHPGFIPELLHLLRRERVPADLFEIEITESMAMLEAEAVHARLNAVRQAGINIAIDDFGTGFSNLSLLSRLPCNQLKIDRSLVKNICTSVKSRQILESIVVMAHAMGHKIVAEGVETVEQYDLLRRSGCDELQGFLLGRPMDPEAISAWDKARPQDPVARPGETMPATLLKAS